MPLNSGNLLGQSILSQQIRVDGIRCDFYINDQKNFNHRITPKANASRSAADGSLAREIRILFKILPSSAVRSPRWHIKLFNDAMAIMSENGKPDIFFTITCNPNWLEIDELTISSKYSPVEIKTKRVDLITRAFQQKFKFIMEDIAKINLWVRLKLGIA